MIRTTLAALALVAGLSLGAGASRGPAVHVAVIDRSSAQLAGASALGAALCPDGMLPDGDACVHIPDDEGEGAPEAESFVNAHHDKRGRWIAYDQIPRRPDRPADYDAYRYPVPCSHGCVTSGYDLDRPDDSQRRARRLRQVGHGAVDLSEARGAPVTLVALEHQEGDAEVLYTGHLFGTTVVTHHTLREGGRLRDYIVLFGHLDTIAPGLAPGAAIRENDLVGTVGDTGSPELVHLHYEVRRVREGVDVGKVPAGGMLLAENISVVCDPRNVLPLK